MAVKREKVHFETVEELLGAPIEKDATNEIRIDQIFPFVNHPFKVVDDDKMDDLVQSIKDNGVIVPVLVRPDDEGTYEMISGHRRMHAAKRAGLTTIPAIIKPMTDDESTIAMVDANMQREEILPSERAFSLKMKMDAMRRQGARTDLDSTSDTEYRRINTAEQIGNECGLKQAQVRRYVRLTELIPEFLDMVDNHRIPIVTAVDLASIDKETQMCLFNYFKEMGTLQKEQIQAIKEQDNLENLTQYTINQLLNAAMPKPKDSGRVNFSKSRLDKYFPDSYSSRKREEIIISLLEKWKEENGDV
ncbi:MAG: ParB/RepB/Spo0J family partition protein [Lachnospiraceae bacterium]|nr:ParB/RepB/Spo0J family partition protein [Lachnospiraceae bacterium]